jgi:hypothetical protein
MKIFFLFVMFCSIGLTGCTQSNTSKDQKTKQIVVAVVKAAKLCLKARFL